MNEIPDHKRLVFDVDGTICSIKKPNEDYSEVEPYQDLIDVINILHDNGYYIIFHTARGMKSHAGDLTSINRFVKPVLEEWLKKHQVKYHELVMGKPFGGSYIDDKGQTPNMFMFGISEILPIYTQKH